MRRPLVAVLVLAVVLAGCDAPVDPTAERTLTPVELPETATGGDSRSADELAPGVDHSGVVAPTRLADAHAAALRGRSYVVSQRFHRTGPNGSLQSRSVVRARFGSTDGRFRYTMNETHRRSGGLVTRHVERFADGTHVYEAVSENGPTRYRLVRTASGRVRSPGTIFPWNLTNRRAIARLFDLVETRVADVRAVNETRTVLVVSEDGTAERSSLQNLSLTATVTRDGLVSTYHVEYEVGRGDDRNEVVVDVAYTAIGETDVVEPSWLDRVNGTDSPATDRPASKVGHAVSPAPPD